MKTSLKITIVSVIVIVSVFTIIFLVDYIQDIQRQEFFSKWREIRESWLDAQNSDMRSFSGVNCSALGITKVDCFFDAYSNCSSAIIDQIRTSIEGDPISVTAMVNSDCNINLIYDSTMDRYSTQEIREFVCYSVLLQEKYLEFNECSDGTSGEEYGFSITR